MHVLRASKAIPQLPLLSNNNWQACLKTDKMFRLDMRLEMIRWTCWCRSRSTAKRGAPITLHKKTGSARRSTAREEKLPWVWHVAVTPSPPPPGCADTVGRRLDVKGMKCSLEWFGSVLLETCVTDEYMNCISHHFHYKYSNLFECYLAMWSYFDCTDLARTISSLPLHQNSKIKGHQPLIFFLIFTD